MTAAALRPAQSSVMADVEVCDEVLGEDLTAYLAGANSVGEFRSWVTGPVLSSDTAARRLAAAVELIGVFHTVNRTALAGSWLREVDASGVVPARALRESTADATTQKVLYEAAEAFLS